MASFDVESDKKIIEKLEKFFTKFKFLEFKKGEIILSANDHKFDIFYIKKGCVKIYSVSNDGNESIYHIARPGSYFPLMLALASKQNRYYYEATMVTEILSAPTEKVIKFIQSDKDVLFDLVIRFGAGLSGMMVRVENLVSDSAYIKIASLLSYFSKKYGKKTAEGILVQLKFSHADIASWLGISRETVSRQMKKFQKQNIICYIDGLILVKDFGKLK